MKVRNWLGSSFFYHVFLLSSDVFYINLQCCNGNLYFKLAFVENVSDCNNNVTEDESLHLGLGSYDLPSPISLIFWECLELSLVTHSAYRVPDKPSYKKKIKIELILILASIRLLRYIFDNICHALLIYNTLS